VSQKGYPVQITKVKTVVFWWFYAAKTGQGTTGVSKGAPVNPKASRWLVLSLRCYLHWPSSYL